MHLSAESIPAATPASTWRHRNGTGCHYFDSERAQALIQDWNSCGNLESLNRLLIHARPLIESIVEYRATTKHEELAELVQVIQIKLWRSLRLFDPSRGSSFSFICRVVSSVSASVVADAWRRSERYVDLDAKLIGKLSSPPGDGHGEAHIEHLVKSIRTTCVIEEELRAQRWYVLSHLDCGFCLRRHECADAAMGVFGLLHPRARQLFDLTLLECRRAVLNGIERRLKPIKVRDIVHSKSAALERYASLLNGEEFTRLCTLLRDLAPSLVLTVRPENALRIQKGEPGPTLENLRLVIDGDPSSRPLFST